MITIKINVYLVYLAQKLHFYSTCSKWVPLCCLVQGRNHSSLCGHSNSKNSVFWGSQSPDGVLQRPLHSVKCTAWVAISKHGIVGLLWFENEAGETVTVNKERYIVVLNKFWRELGARCGVNQAVQWFQQDGATPHTANITMEWLDHRYPNRLISRRRANRVVSTFNLSEPPGFFF